MRRRAAIQRVDDRPVGNVNDPFDQALAMLEQELSILRYNAQTAIQSKDVRRSCEQFHIIRQRNARLKELKNAFNALKEQLSMEQLPELFREKGSTSQTFPGIGQFYITHRTSASVVDQGKMVAWMQRIGRGEELSLGIASTRLGAIVSEELKAGREPPGDAVRVNIKPNVTRRDA